jgi:hypothetical protein
MLEASNPTASQHRRGIQIKALNDMDVGCHFASEGSNHFLERLRRDSSEKPRSDIFDPIMRS